MANRVSASTPHGAKHQYANTLNPGQVVRSMTTLSHWIVTNNHKFVSLETGFLDPGLDPYIVGEVLPFGSSITLVVE